MNQCEKCKAEFYYDPKNHRCKGDWEAIAGETPKVELTTWAEECVNKVMGDKR